MQPLHRELNVLRLQMAPALDFVWYCPFGKRWKYSAASFLAAVRSFVNFSRTNGSLGTMALNARNL